MPWWLSIVSQLRCETEELLRERSERKRKITSPKAKIAKLLRAQRENVKLLRRRRKRKITSAAGRNYKINAKITDS